MDAWRADRYNRKMRFPPLLPLALAASLLSACGGPNPEQAARYAALVEDKLKPMGTGADQLLPMFVKDGPWNKEARVLTDQYSPSNLLNTDP